MVAATLPPALRTEAGASHPGALQGSPRCSYSSCWTLPGLPDTSPTRADVTLSTGLHGGPLFGLLITFWVRLDHSRSRKDIIEFFFSFFLSLNF